MCDSNDILIYFSTLSDSFTVKRSIFVNATVHNSIKALFYLLCHCSLMCNFFGNLRLLQSWLSIFRNKKEQSRNDTINRDPEPVAETHTAQPIVTFLPQHITFNKRNEENYATQNNNTISVPQTSQTIQSSEQLQSIEFVDANYEVTDKIYNENGVNTPREINIDLDDMDPSLPSDNSKSYTNVNNASTVVYNDIQNAKDLWGEDDMVNVMDYTMEEPDNMVQNNTVCSGTINDEDVLKSNRIGSTLGSNQSNLFDLEPVISSAIAPVETFSNNLEKPTYNDRYTSNKMVTTIEEALPVAPHINQHFSFEITASGADNDIGKPMTITINPIEIKPKNNAETESTTPGHGKNKK